MTKIDWLRFPNFNRDEFDSPDAPGSGDLMQPVFLARLQCAREAAGIAFKINSGYRTESHNKIVGGKADSSHLKGCAADIHCVSDSDCWKIVASLMDAGFNRIGIARTFIHVDSDESKNAERIWKY